MAVGLYIDLLGNLQGNNAVGLRVVGLVLFYFKHIFINIHMHIMACIIAKVAYFTPSRERLSASNISIFSS